MKRLVLKSVAAAVAIAAFGVSFAQERTFKFGLASPDTHPDTAKKDSTRSLVLPLEKERLKTAPGFDKKNWPDLSDRQQVLTIYEYDDVPLHGGTNADRQGK